LWTRAYKSPEQVPVGGFFPLNISVAAQNCNSLNVSMSCEKQIKKITALVGLKNDFILLSDLRLCDKKTIDSITKSFSCNKLHSYKFFHNSSKNKRGVGILISDKIDFSCVEEYRDVEENILGLRLCMNNCMFWIVAVYGPNSNDINFFRNLSDLINRNQNYPFIIGGDFNCTVSNNDPAINLDIFNMQNIPSIFRTNLLQEIINSSSLTDPFRALWPLKADYTYIPRADRNNRSRIDFFLVSDSILPAIEECGIGTGLLSTLFDNKNIFLKVGNLSTKPATFIFPSTIAHNRFNYICNAAVVDCYLIHADPETPNLDIMKNSVGTVLLLIRELNDLEWKTETEGDSEENRSVLLQTTALLENAFQVLPGMDFLTELALVPPPDVFF
jgi:exonuclease III